MHFERNLSLRQRLLLTGTILAVGPLLCLGFIVCSQFSAIVRTAEDGSSKLAASDLDHLTETIYATADSLQNDVLTPLQIAKSMLIGYGGLTFPRHKHTKWHATNQVTHETAIKSLPAAIVGRKSRRAAAPSQVQLVDAVKETSGAACAVFQRMNPAGDMIRIASSVTAADGKREIGTYMPAVNADGSPNTAIQSVLRKEQFVGKETLDGEPFSAAYDAITKSDGDVIGMLYVALPDNAETGKVLKAASAIKLENGLDIFAIHAGGPDKGKYAFSTRFSALEPGFEATGMIQAALAHPHDVVEQHYESTRQGRMVAHVKYSSRSNWVLGVAVPEEQYLQTYHRIQTVAAESRQWILWPFAISVFISTLVWFRYAKSFIRPVAGFAKVLRQETGRLLHLSNELARMAEQQNEELASQSETVQKAEQSSTSLHQAARRNTEQASVALSTANEFDEHSQKAADHLDAMQASMLEIRNSNTKISSIMKSIDEIAFQSRILALNAAIEAARAGEAGVSFAVVADEFGNLARRCAEASNATTEVVADCMKSTGSGAEKLKELDTAVRRMTANTASVKASIHAVQLANEEQTAAIGAMGAALNKTENAILPTHVQEKQISEQAVVLRDRTLELSYLVHGRKRKKHARKIAQRAALSAAKSPALRPQRAR